MKKELTRQWKFQSACFQVIEDMSKRREIERGREMERDRGRQGESIGKRGREIESEEGRKHRREWEEGER